MRYLSSIYMLAVILAGCYNPTIEIPNKINNEDINKSYNIDSIKNNDSLVLSEYGLSESFMKNLKAFVNDQVLNKTEIKFLEQYADNDKEKHFIEIIKNKTYFEMSNLKYDNKEPDTLKFIINSNFDIDGKFLQKFYQANKEKKVLNLGTIQDLYSYSSNEEKEYLDWSVKYDFYNFPVLDNNNIKNLPMNIYYDENDTIAGNSIYEIISNIGQGDRLQETSTDSFRCGSAVIINSILLFRGLEGFYNISKKMNLNFDKLTYKNIHLAQDSLMKGVKSFYSGLSMSYDNKGKLGSGTLFDALKFCNIKWNPNYLPKINNSYKESIEKVFLNSKNTSIIVCGYLDTVTGEINFHDFPNHSFLLTKNNGRYYFNNTGGRNGKYGNNFPLTEKQLSELYNTNNILIEISV